MKNLIVVGGMKRSGTTWMYNTIRVALDQAGERFTVSGSLAEAKTLRGTVLLKSHWYQPSVARMARLVFTSERNVLEVYESLTHLWGRPPTGAEMAKIVEHWRRWDQSADYRMRYGHLAKNPEGITREIIKVLGLRVDARRVHREVAKLEPPEEGQDPVTLLFWNHIRE